VDLRAGTSGQDPEAVVFDFVNLIPAGRRSVGADRQARLRDVVGWLAGTRAIQRRTAKI